MSADVAVAVMATLVMASFCLVLNMKAGATWLRLLSLWAMLAFASLAGYVIVRAVLFAGGAS